MNRISRELSVLSLGDLTFSHNNSEVWDGKTRKGKEPKCLTMTDHYSKEVPVIEAVSTGCDAPHPPGGKPVQNAFIESFDGKFRDKCLNERWFLTLQEAQVVIEALALLQVEFSLVLRLISWELTQDIPESKCVRVLLRKKRSSDRPLNS